jgi:hypothetical protein
LPFEWLGDHLGIGQPDQNAMTGWAVNASGNLIHSIGIVDRNRAKSIGDAQIIHAATVGRMRSFAPGTETALSAFSGRTQ